MTQKVKAQPSCTNEDVPTNITYSYVGSNYGVETLSEAISLGLMAAPVNSPNPAAWSGQNIFVSGLFTIDDVASLYNLGSLVTPGNPGNTHIIMDSGARIAVDCDDMQFNITGAIIRGCSGFWNSIRIASGMYFVMSATRVYDGSDAVQVMPDARVDIRGCLFEDNIVGVHLFGGDHQKTIIAVTNSSFIGNTGGLIAAASQYFNTSYAGIILRDKPNVGPMGGNLFRGVQNGILAFNCNLAPSITPNLGFANIYQDIRPAQATDNPLFGNAVLLQHSYLLNSLSNIRGQGGVSSPMGYNSSYFDHDFENCLRGVVLDDANAFIYDCAMIDCDTSILVRNTLPTTGTLFPEFFDNEIQNSTDIGICFLDNAEGYKCEIHDNIIDVNSAVQSRGMYAFANGFSHEMYIESNEVNIHSNGIGIELDQVQDVSIADENEFNVQSTGYPYTCVLVNNASDGTSVVNNYFNGFDQGPVQAGTYNRVGLRVIESESTEANCNVFDNVAVGMIHDYNNGGTMIQSNIFRSGSVGYALGSPQSGGGVIDEQGPDMIGNENIWPVSTTGDFYVSWDAISFNGFYVNNDLSRFWSDDDDTGGNYEFWPDKISQVAGGNWFQADIDVYMQGAGGCSAFLGPDPSDELSALDNALLGGNPNLGYDYFNWRAKWGFLVKQDRNPDLLSVTGVSNWRDTALASPMGQLYIIQRDLETGTVMNAEDRLMLDSLNDLTAGWLASLAFLDSLFVADGALSSTQVSAYDSLIDLVLVHATTEEAIRDTLRLQVESLCQDLLSELGGISTTLDFDTHLKSILEIRLKMVQSGGQMPDSTDWAILEDLAASCRYVDGVAVPMARSIIRRFEGNNQYGDHPDCLNESFAEATTRSISPLATGLQVIPSVTNGEVHVFFEEAGQRNSVSYRVFNTQGDLSSQGILSVGASSIDLSHLPSGMYLIQFMDDQNLPIVRKVTKL